ncbi:MAG: hypothetical protein ACLRPQ_01390 [Streptococcus sp.]
MKIIDGKQYYVENGVVKKNAAIELDGRLYYFDETGAMVIKVNLVSCRCHSK